MAGPQGWGSCPQEDSLLPFSTTAAFCFSAGAGRAFAACRDQHSTLSARPRCAPSPPGSACCPQPSLGPVPAGRPTAAVWDPAQTLSRETPSQFPASPSVSPLVSFPGQLLSLAPANAAPGKQRCRQEHKKLPVPQGLKVALSSCHTPHPAHTCPGQAVPSANPPTRQVSRSHTRHSTNR